LQVHLDAQPEATTTQIHFVIEVRNRTHLAQLIKRLRRERGVIRIQRPLGPSPSSEPKSSSFSP
jgi:(p)ppGpp synthase/HD superfamily hydrolase